MDEAALVRRAQTGDTLAFDELVGLYQRAVFGFVQHLVGSADDAAEVTQEVFVRAWRYLDRFDPARPLKPWLYTIAANRAHSHRRHEQPRETVALDEAGPEPAAPDNPAGDLERHELSCEVRAAIRQLSAQQRDAMVLVELEGMTAVEAAAVMKIEAVTVRQHVFRGKKRLRELLAGYIDGRSSEDH
ncbi:MAG: sigma-70 family RNA polymerase sigma factor [Fimbriimonadaceae bacterium]|nr:sigma-70 family RNA polymerase sigma factor [Fimbriimonadaceae bacterium]